jgi:signal peptidase II
MQKVNHPQGKWQNVVFFLIALLLLVADQVSKMWIRSYPENELIFEVGFFRVANIHNSGAAFGLFQGQSFALTLFAFISVIVLLLCVFFFYRRSSFLDSGLVKAVLGLILGGIVGNLIDRLQFGYVTDFIGVGIWPSFNVADSAITIGVIIFACSLLRLTQAEKR